jgi:AcrR family transcriptional regulator
MPATAQPRRGRGRPIDPDLEQRVFDAAIQLYAEAGWAGFTYDALAERARAGKAAIYRRWESKRDLFREAWRAAYAGFIVIPDTGRLRGDLVCLARAVLERFDGPVGLAEVRLLADAKAFPDEFGELDLSRAAVRRAAREAADRAVARGELPAGTRPEVIFDLVRGAVIHNYLSVPRDKEEAWRARRLEFAEEVVDIVLAGLMARSPGGPGMP